MNTKNMVFQDRGRPQGKSTKRDIVIFQNRDRIVFELSKILQAIFDALDRLYRPDRPRVVEAVSNNSLQKG